MTAVTTNHERDPGWWMVLVACIIAVRMVAIDTGMLSLIEPAIQAKFNSSQSTIGLMTSISTLMLAAFILGGGTLGDLYGRRQFILIGATVVHKCNGEQCVSSLRQISLGSQLATSWR